MRVGPQVTVPLIKASTRLSRSTRARALRRARLGSYQADLTDNRGDVIGRRSVPGEVTHRLVNSSDEVSRVVLKMAFYKRKSSVRTKLRIAAAGCLRDPIGQQDEGFTVVQRKNVTGAEPSAGEEA